jgi:transposase
MDGPECPGCRQRDALIAELLRRVADLEGQVRDLQARLGVNASNSSLPPSANPLGAPKPVVKKPTGRRPGGQPGHEPHLRCRLPAERLAEVVPFVPTHCRGCHASLPAQAGPNDPEPSWHQVAELPVLAAAVTEYQGHARTCPACGVVTRAAIPAEHCRGILGPRLAALLAYLNGAHHVSHRGLAEIAETVFEVPLALGTVVHLQDEMSRALAAAHAEALAAVRAAPVKHVDETGWKRAGTLCWLWLAASHTVAAFVVHTRRSAAGLAALLGESSGGVVCSDRFSAYARLPVEQRQVCWAHLRRDFQKCVDGGGLAAAFGAAALSVTQRVFEEWHLFRGGTIDRQTLQQRLRPEAERLGRLLEIGGHCAEDAKLAKLCRNVGALAPALWTFLEAEGVEPTNNHAERLLRRGVLWRKRSLGSQCIEGCAFVARMLSVLQTLRLQHRGVLAYLQAALTAHRAGIPGPQLLPSG